MTEWTDETKAAKIIPIRGKFESAAALLHYIAQDDDIAEFVIYAICKNGDGKRAHFEMSRANMAYAAVTLAEWCRSEDY